MDVLGMTFGLNNQSRRSHPAKLMNRIVKTIELVASTLLGQTKELDNPSSKHPVRFVSIT